MEKTLQWGIHQRNTIKTQATSWPKTNELGKNNNKKKTDVLSTQTGFFFKLQELYQLRFEVLNKAEIYK